MDAILILGAAVWENGPSPTLLRRTRHAATLWNAKVAPFVIPCGGLGKHPPTEAAMMTRILQEHHVPRNAILQEDRSTTTLENLRFALPILSQIGARKVTIVTDTYHARRAKMVARHFGLIAVVSSPPTSRPKVKATLREWAALPFYAARLRRMGREG